MQHDIALLGFGTVGQGLAEILLRERDALRRDVGVDFRVTAVSDLARGSVFRSEGLDLQAILSLAEQGTSLEELKGVDARGWDATTTITESGARSVCEITWTDLATAEPATGHCRAALERGMNVVTSNKGPAARHYAELVELARSNDASFLIEGTVMSGTPVLNFARHTLAGNPVHRIRGILNGTTNFMLGQMEEGKSYGDALATAQELGYAEADPTADVEGHDALAKVVILANVVMGATLTPEAIPCEGITRITPDQVQRAHEQGLRYKLIGEVVREGLSVRASVAPMTVDLDHPLAGVGGATNALTFSTGFLGDVTVSGPGAGRRETGYSLLVDLIEAARR